MLATPFVLCCCFTQCVQHCVRQHPACHLLFCPCLVMLSTAVLCSSTPLRLCTLPARVCAQDYTGSSVYCQSQLDAVFAELSSTMFGNPHAQNPSSELSSQRIDAVRAMILKHFNADPAEWQIVF